MCPLCEREKSLRAGTYPYLIKELTHSWWLLGEHQFFPGYSVLLLKGHAREMTELPTPIATAVFQELLSAQKAVEKVFTPLKMNICSLGNVVDHMHWHLFPRQLDDPQRLDPPWLRMQEFSSKNVTPEEAFPTINTLRAFLE